MTGGMLQTVVAREGDGMVVALVGELDLSTCPVASALFDSVDWDSLEQLTVDLRQVKFIDSTGLHMLLSLRDATRSRAVSLRLIAGPERVQRVFELTGTTVQFAWVDTAPPTARRRRPPSERGPRHDLSGPTRADPPEARPSSHEAPGSPGPIADQERIWTTAGRTDLLLHD